MNLKTRLERLANVANLQNGWHDGEGIAPEKYAVSLARQMIMFVDEQLYFTDVSIFPLFEGGIELVLHAGPYDYEVEYRNDLI